MYLLFMGDLSFICGKLSHCRQFARFSENLLAVNKPLTISAKKAPS